MAIDCCLAVAAIEMLVLEIILSWGGEAIAPHLQVAEIL